MTCAFGTPWAEHAPFAPPLFACAGCRDESSRLSAEFHAAVARGEFDAEGYTPAERKAQQRRKSEAV
jgi:hypothetical protein